FASADAFVAAATPNRPRPRTIRAALRRFLRPRISFVIVVSCFRKGGMPFDGQEHRNRAHGAMCWGAQKSGFAARLVQRFHDTVHTHACHSGAPEQSGGEPGIQYSPPPITGFRALGHRPAAGVLAPE